METGWAVKNIEADDMLGILFGMLLGSTGAMAILLLILTWQPL